MTKRVRILIWSGVALLAVSWVGLTKLVEWSRPKFERQGLATYLVADSREGRPVVVLGWDGNWGRGGSVVHLDVRGARACSRADGKPVGDVVAYLNAEMRRTKAECVIVSAANGEKFGDIVAVVDACRRTEVGTIILNQYPLTW